MFSYHHPTLAVDSPAEGHYVLTGLPQQSVFIEGEGTVVAPQLCYISPAVPDDFLEAVLRDRADRRSRGVESAPATIEAKPVARRGRPPKNRVVLEKLSKDETNADTTSIAPMNRLTDEHELRTAPHGVALPPENAPL